MSIRVVSFGVVMFAAVGAASGGSILLNGGFELGTGSVSDIWNQFAGGAAGTMSERSSMMPNTGDFSQRIVAVGAAGIGSAAGINQNSIDSAGFPSLAELTVVTASFSAKVDLGPGGVGFYELKILNGEGAVVATSGLQNLNPSANYLSYNLAANVPAFGAAPNDVYAAFLEVVVAAGAFDGSTASAFVDDAAVDGILVPGPSSLVALAFGTAGLARRRRR